MKIRKILFQFLVLCATTPLLAANSPEATNASVAPGVAPYVHPLKAEGISNFFRLSEKIYSGSAPQGDAAFAALKNLGVKTIITVDGAKPDVESARRFGIRYVHLPFGYDGVPTNQAYRLVKAAETLPGPIFVHCHHGQHRGPSGAAVICMATAGWTPEEAVAWLHLVGTATNYPGLYRTVGQFQPPSAAILKNVSNDFPEKSEVSALADVMIQIDGEFDKVKLIKAAGYKTPSSHPDLTPEPEALLLDELFKELIRSPVVESRPQDFKDKLLDAEDATGALHLSLSVPAIKTARSDVAFQRIIEACAACHKVYRN